ncbi:hypothetical protein KAFR_0C05700 [Kazachstania africana CBS 2517]|uniref:GDP-mannose transporter n=1 Tax=Kazachstania africana (strain ATCC 22294 / BCRC 22015 / CBS 2517 / CECT 1963 / NBRC 1671 / NRRL Y-8276) TaxID=1071382 RepID=H2AT61_KAZAF|nr:hypothetical protein KAFR_0C05700 [Kazachstania africana CBS 2517]CCF57561.1 hypothetical protein KAFR_0C05700 [Kazachstania africana CBS 2517]
MLKLILLYTAGWYICAITLSVYNKWMFGGTNGLGVAYPILVTTCHQVTLWVLSFCYIRYYLKDTGNVFKRLYNKEWQFYLKFLVPTAVATAGDVGLSNASFKYVPLIIYTIIKSSSIAFVLLFGCLFKVEKFHWKLGTIVISMFVGVCMMVYQPSNGSAADENSNFLILVGSLMVLASSCLSGFRWVYTQVILKGVPNENVEIRLPDDDDPHIQGNLDSRLNSSTGDKVNGSESDKPHPVYTICQLAPLMAVALVITSLLVEQPTFSLSDSKLFSYGSDTGVTTRSFFVGIMLLLIPGVLVFGLTLSEFGILQITKVLTVSVIGVIKEVLTVLIGVWFLHERISGWLNWLGVVLILSDVLYYNYFRYGQNQEQGYSSLAMNDLESPSDIEEHFTLGDKIATEPYPLMGTTMQGYEADVLTRKLSGGASNLGSDVPVDEVLSTYAPNFELQTNSGETENNA